MKIQTARTHSFSEHALSCNYRISMDTKGPINPPSQHKSYIHVIIDAFSHFVVTVPIKTNNAETAKKLFYLNGSSNLVHLYTFRGFEDPTYRGSEYINNVMAYPCTLMGIRHSPRTAYRPWRC